jgi:hypothetical protein
MRKVILGAMVLLPAVAIGAAVVHNIRTAPSPTAPPPETPKPPAASPPAVSPPEVETPPDTPLEKLPFAGSFTDLEFTNLYDRRKDDAAFWNRFEGKAVEVTGFVWFVNAEPTDGSPPAFLLFESNDKDANHPLICEFAPADVPTLRALRDGEKLTVRGRCTKDKHPLVGQKLTVCTIRR